MSIAERIYETVKTLPDQDAAEVLDFVEFLQARQAKRRREGQEQSVLPSLEGFRQGLPFQPISAGEFCRTMREEERY